MDFSKIVLVTGGAGFIGSHLVRRLVNRYPDYLIINLDKLTYAGNLENLNDVEGFENYRFVKGDITDEHFIDQLFAEYPFDGVFHLAAESHVDRSIENPLAFIDTNVRGTAVLMNACRKIWCEKARLRRRFLHVSTDEVFGSLGAEGAFHEDTPYDPRSPYSASKASSDHLVMAYFHTYGFPAVITNCSNNYGSHQFPEKLIPLMINNIRHQRPLPVYGAGENIRDWLHVQDHVAALDLAFHKGIDGETYCIGGGNEWRNIDLVKLLCKVSDELLGRASGEAESLITFVTDRKGHDHRYAIDASKITSELGWLPKIYFEDGLRATVQWYLDHDQWMEHVTSGDYLEYYNRHYSRR